MENVSLHAPSVPGLGGANLVEMKRDELLNINGGDWHRIQYSTLDMTTGEETWYTGFGLGGIIWHTVPGLYA